MRKYCSIEIQLYLLYIIAEDITGVPTEDIIGVPIKDITTAPILKMHQLYITTYSTGSCS